MKTPRRFKAAFGGALATALLVSAIAFWRCLPEPLFDALESVALYDRQGELLGARIAADGQWRFAPPDHASEKLASAVVAFEDKRFYQHPGVDPLAIVRAAWSNVRAGQIRSGGSTLSMQLARLARGNTARTFREKLIEAIWALRLELKFSKSEILALYLGHAPYGGNVVGVDAAAWRYFGRSPEHLSWAEAAMLAVLPNSPALIHPGRSRDRLRTKRDRLLTRLHEYGVIDALNLQLARAEALPQAPRPLPRLAPHLLDTLAAKQAEAKLHSTLDASLQRAALRSVRDYARSYRARGVHHAAAIIIDNQSFEVLAYVGNATNPGRGRRRTVPGDAVDVVQRPRSTGSLLKPFLYAAMMQDGRLQPGSLVPDVPMQFTGFRPENFDRQFRGAVRARDALAQSLNVPAVHLLREYGQARFYDLLTNMGMSSLFRSPEGYGLALILGGAEGTLWDLSQMYANLVRVSSQGAARGVTRYARARLLLSDAPQLASRSELGAGAAWLTLGALEQVSRPELDQHWKNFSSARRLAWKTGTSYGLRDAWAIGMTPRYTVGVWVGNASGEGRAGLTGAGMAAPVLFDIVNALPGNDAFDAPMSQLRKIEVCADDGYLPRHGCDTELQWVPLDARFETVSRHHRIVHLDASRQWQVDGRCHPVSSMVVESRFVLPPAQEHFYRAAHPDYRVLPPWRPDCMAQRIAEGEDRPFELIYPNTGSEILIPTDLAQTRSRSVFEAVHRREDAVLWWHVNEQFVGQTEHFHQLAVDLPPGRHRLTLVDDQGHRQQRRFSVIDPASGATESRF